LSLPEAVEDGGVATGIGGRGNGGSDTVGMERRWCGRYLRVVGAVWMRSARDSDRAADGGPHAVLIFFSI
jgi:hypothetical protein